MTKVECSNDPADTPCVTTTYDRLGRRKTVTVEPTLLQAGITTTYAYNDTGQVLTETMSGGIMNGITVSRSYNNSLRMDGLNVNGTSTPYDADYGYDTAGRLRTVINGDNSATYAYHANSPLIQTVTFKKGTATRMITTRNYDNLNRLTGISSVSYPTTQPSTINSSDYQLNTASQRVRNTLPDGSYWEYTYDTMGQVKSGKHYWADGTPVAGQQYEYAFDDIGNRTGAKMGGDNAGANLRTASYTTDRLNRYSSRTVPSYADIVGIANPAASVTVNSQATTRKGEYFWKALNTPNGSAPWYSPITINSTYGGGQSDTGTLFVPKTPESFSYDEDGNLTQDGRWIYTWDAENRLIRMVAATAFGPQQRIEFGYDSLGRRISKKVWPNTQGTGPLDVDQRFVYDGWNLLAILNSSFSLLTSYTWGLDLSGTMQGAGGVGGLLWASEINGSGVTTESHYAAYDGNGNVTSLTKASDGSESARYEYGPFGEVIRMTGAYAKVNPFRFSTKFTDDESGLLYYGYRYYNPSTGRWLSRDPIEERGGRNLYSCLKNNTIRHIDKLGMQLCGYGCMPKDCNGVIDDDAPTTPTEPMPCALTRSIWTWFVWGYLHELGIEYTPEWNDTSWYDKNRSNSVNAAKQYFKKKIRQQRDKLCNGEALSAIPDFDVAPMDSSTPSEKSLGDAQQTIYESEFWIGWYSFRLGTVETTKLPSGYVNFHATIAIVDKLGAQEKHTGKWGYLLFMPIVGPEREVSCGTYEIDGCVRCCDPE